ACGGTRLRPEALAVTIGGRSIADVATLSIDELAQLFGQSGNLSRRGFYNCSEGENLSGRGSFAGRGFVASAFFGTIRQHVLERCDVLQHLGLGYLTLDRESTTLAGGEAQRIKIARQAGLGLRGMLYVLDEPSVGLHHRDTGRLLDVLRTIRDRGNTVLVVEHDDQAVRQADWLVDVGPGAGADGGEVLYSGPVDRFLADEEENPRRRESRTWAFLTGREQIAVPARRRSGHGTLTVAGLTRHNLADVTVEFLLGAFNVVTGVSGAGKSTLVRETRRLIEGDGTGPGRLSLSEPVAKVIDIDQAPIGRTPRSNPATYTGLFDHVRDLFTRQPTAVERGYAKGRFSFNVKGGRCDVCEGAGVTQIGMQFLGSVAVTCEQCGGRRFNDETLEVRYRGLTISDVLSLSIADAVAFFADQPAITRILRPLHRLGIGYLPLGHPATMLSGGEAQRVKIATELARPAAARTLYLLDEPTTGLHAADIVRLLAAIDDLVARGHTVIAIEHHLDVIKTADRVIDLGPESGALGGRVVAAGTPEAIADASGSATGAALREVLRREVVALRGCEPASVPRAGAEDDEPIRFTNVCTHNLQHVDVAFPRNRITVLTGVSGSGKSSLAFDTLFAEGQQRFAESFSTYARRFVVRANESVIDEVTGLTPTIAISQRAPSRNPRSTVATLTEIHDAYRLLFSRAGTRHCPRCGAGLAGGRCACGFAGPPTLTSAMFSPNSEAGACPACHGLGSVMLCDPHRLITDPSRPVADGLMDGHKAGRFYGDPHGQHMATLAAAGAALEIDLSGPWSGLEDSARHLVLHGCGDRLFDVDWRYQRGARAGSHRFQATWPGLLALVRQEYERKHGDARGDTLEALMIPVPCSVCGGGRLKPESLAVRFAGASIHDLLAMTVSESLAFFRGVENGSRPIDDRIRAMTADLRHDIVARLESLRDAGLSYLALDRAASTLSGGEAQRVRLAAELRSGLTGITYVLDEPTAGLHPRDTVRLIGLLHALRDAGNTVVVVEHDLDVIAAADHAIEIGPGAGRDGGAIVAQGRPGDLANAPSSVTGRFLRLRCEQTAATPARALRPGVHVRGAAHHNLRGIDVSIPAGGLVAITGVSGSGKSSLVFDVLAPSIREVLAAVGAGAAPVGCREVVMHERFARAVDVATPGPSGSAWSTPAT
ncbi:MAG: ATP-binding cassette domain-containing protein, partial [Acidobacteria bacterium]|nr:ATP-binding cassette domain-containing protein [Acidobacteriota bacterium]